ncbi:hypothetical protein ACFUIZ_27630 [Streptomyces cinereoruber]|uniref:hypothetical protein n=1 Tax=Streptomyces cinereoruber TaxID=67260 RepID=UPI003627E7AB
MFDAKPDWWGFAHELRTDLPQLCGNLLLLLLGTRRLFLRCPPHPRLSAVAGAAVRG